MGLCYLGFQPLAVLLFFCSMFCSLSLGFSSVAVGDGKLDSGSVICTWKLSEGSLNLFHFRQHLNFPDFSEERWVSQIHQLILSVLFVIRYCFVSYSRTQDNQSLKPDCLFHGTLEAFESLNQMFISAGFVVFGGPADLCFVLPKYIHWKLVFFFQ